MPAPVEIIDLINRFEQHLDADKDGLSSQPKLRGVLYGSYEFNEQEIGILETSTG